MESLVALWLFVSISLSGSLSVVNGQACTEEGDVRQSFGQFGRVEICRDGMWGTICADSADQPWALKNAQVVCRQIDGNIGGALNSVLQNTIPARASNDTPIHYHNVTCLGYEERVTDCLLNEGVAQGCTHEWDVAVTCKGNLDARGDIRLTGDSSNSRGAVEIYDTTIINWATICPDDWTPQLANAACVQLGYESGSSETFSFTAPANRVGERVVEAFNCPSPTLTLKDCTFESSLSPLASDCTAAEGMFAGVNCISSTEPEGSVRLFGANSSSEGRVEILYNGRWGTVCDEFWDRTDGETACRQLGEYNESFTVDVNPDNEPRYIGDSRDKPVWLTNLDCSRSDDSLSNCPRFGAEDVIGYTTFCTDHSQDAAVDCVSTDGSGSGAKVLGSGILMTFVLLCLGFLLSSSTC